MDGAADIGDGHHPHAGRGQEEDERTTDLAEALDDGPSAGQVHLFGGEDGADAADHSGGGGPGMKRHATDGQRLAGDDGRD